MTEFRPTLGVDVGGTFTDFIDAEGKSLKILSQTTRPGRVMAEGVSRLQGGSPVLQIAHGTTVATNAILTDNLARAGMLVTRGFRDVLALGRQARPILYDLEPTPVFSGPDSGLIIEVDERIGPDGEIMRPLDWEAAVEAAEELAANGVPAFAVCLLHSYRNPEHEEKLADEMRRRGLLVCTSSEIVPEFREFERFSTAFTNAGLMPLLRSYVDDLEEKGASIRGATGAESAPRYYLMQSDGGVIPPDLAADEPVRMVLSGPAGGLVGAWSAVAGKERQRLMTFDMGGTSTDVALMDGGEPVIGQAELAGRPLLVPVLDIHTVGAGGGSIARRDSGGALLVGPASAGSDPGPACYGRGGPFTVTDAHVLLGRIPPGHFLGGDFQVDADAAGERARELADSLGLTPETLALGVLEVAEATMERALRRISLERGFDPRRFSLVCFGGAGALHAASLMTRLDMPEAVIPRDPGLLSAKGMLHARLKREYSRSLLGVPIADFEASPQTHFESLAVRARRDMHTSGIDAHSCSELRFCDLRYLGQSFSITVPYSPGSDLVESFHQAHARKYGFDFRADSRPVEIVGLRLRIIAAEPPAEINECDLAPEDVARAFDCQEAVFTDGPVDTPIYRRDDLGAGTTLIGPAIVVEYSSTVVVPPGFEVEVEAHGNLVLRCGA